VSRAWARYALLAAFFGLMVASPWMTAAVVGIGLATTAYRVGRLVATRLGRKVGRPQSEIVLGTGRSGRVVTVSTAELAAHGLILGASGSGKTTALLTILQQQIGRGQPVVAIDMKGSPGFARQLAAAAAAAGRPFRLWTPDGPSHWNPLQHGNPTELKDKLICTERFTEPHYQRAAERYVQTVLQVLEHTRPGGGPTLDQVVALMDPRRLPSILREVPRPLADRVQDYRAGLTPDQLSAIRGLQTRLAIVTESHTGHYLAPGGGESVDLRAALHGSEVVLFSLNSSRYQSFASQLAALVVQDLICATGTRLEELGVSRELEQATVAIDEFSGIGGEHVVALFARGREAGVGVLLATQEMADLDRAGHGVRDQVLGSTAFKLILRQDVPASAQMGAQIAGTEKAWEETRQIGGTLFPSPRGRGTRREVERFVVDPNEIQSLRTGEAILISKLRGGAAERIRIRPPERLAMPVESVTANGRGKPAEQSPPQLRPEPELRSERSASARRPPRLRRENSTRRAAPPERRAKSSADRSGPELG
jgi:conjugal transfer pilus assembly protein TraD